MVIVAALIRLSRNTGCGAGRLCTAALSKSLIWCRMKVALYLRSCADNGTVMTCASPQRLQQPCRENL